MRSLLRMHETRLLDAAFYAAAASIAGWSLLVMLRAQFPADSDGLWLLSFAHDIAQHIPLRGWHLPGAPSYFPELFSILITRSMGSSPRASLLIHGVCSWLLLGAGIYWGLRLVRLGAWRAGRVAFAAMLVYLLLHCASPLLQPFAYPFSHGGALLAGFLRLLYIAHPRQEIKFLRDSRRLQIVPAGVDLRTIDSVFITGSLKLQYRVRRIALMWDQDLELLRSHSGT